MRTILEKRGWKQSRKKFFISWLIGPLAQIADAIVTLVVYPFGYGSCISLSYLGWAIGIKEDTNEEPF